MSNDFDGPYGALVELPATSHGLVSGLRAWNQERLDRFVRLYGPWVYRCVATRLRDRREAADIAQSALLRILSSVHRYQPDGDVASFRRWLSCLITVEVKDYHRKRQRAAFAEASRETEVAIDQHADNLESDEADIAFVKLVHDAYEMIRPFFRENTLKAARMVAIDRWPPAEVAKELGMSVAAVYTARSRVFQKLQETLRGQLPDAAPE